MRILALSLALLISAAGLPAGAIAPVAPATTAPPPAAPPVPHSAPSPSPSRPPAAQDDGRTAALERYRQEFGRARPSRVPLAAGDREFRLFVEVLDRTLAEHVKPTTAVALIDQAIEGLRKEAKAAGRPGDHALTLAALNGMLGSLDAYSGFLEGADFQEMRSQTQGQFGGIGIEVTLDRDQGLPRVIAPIDDTPAARAGLKAGDLLTHVDGASLQGVTLTDVVKRLRGAIGTPVRVTVRRADGTTPTVDLTRALVTVKPVRPRMEGDIAYVRLSTFNARTATELEQAVKGLAAPGGGRPAGLVLDLRNNPGGLLDQAVAVADLFLDDGDIVSVRGRDPQRGQRYRARKGDILRGVPIVVLTNPGSASASEIVAAALQDNRRAVVLGERSFGKGSVQTVTPLGPDSALRLTTARYVRPAGTYVDCVGVSPNVEVRPATPVDPASRPACDAAGAKPPPIAVYRAQDMCPTAVTGPESADPELTCAVEALKTRIGVRR